MKGSFCYLLLAAACLQVAVLQEPECPIPTPTNCTDTSLCDDNTCPRYTSVKCCVELVEEECTAQFYRLPKLEQVTGSCFQAIESCLTKECNSRRMCVEEVIGCPEGREGCGIKRVKAACVQIQMHHVPSSCDEIVCGKDTTCVVSETRRGTIAQCKLFVPESCDELECDDGMQCV